MSFQTRNLYHLRVNKHSILPLYLYLDESHVDWMTRSILKDIIADLKPLIGPKLVKESHIGASGLSASAMKKAGHSVVEVQRGENYQFAYFLKPAESYDLLIKARDFVEIIAPPGHLDPLEEVLTPETSGAQPDVPSKMKKRAPKSRSRPKISSAAKKRKRVEASEEEDAEMSEAWSDLDEGHQASDNDEVEFVPSSAVPTRRSVRHKSGPQVQPIDDDMEEGDDPGPSVLQDPQATIAVKPEPDDTSAFTNLLTISADEEVGPATQPPSPKAPSDQLMIEEEEEKPKQELHLTYAGYVVPSRCICVIAEPWPALPTPAQLASQATKSRPKSPAHSAPVNARPLFRPESDDEEDTDRDVSMQRRDPTPGFDSDDEEGRLRMFSQMLNKVGGRHSGVAARGAMDEFEDDALYGDADEEGRGV